LDFMDPKTSTPELAFAKALRSYQTGGITFTDFLAQVSLQLAAGASPAKLLEILQHREFLEPLPGSAHDAVVGLLHDAVVALLKSPPPRPTGNAAAPPMPATVKPIPPTEQSTVILDEVDSGSDGTPLPAEGAPLFTQRAPPAAERAPPPSAGTARRKSIAVGDLLLGRFHLVELIGEGGMSRVYKAIDRVPAHEYSSDSFIAVKVLTRPFNEQVGSFSALQPTPSAMTAALAQIAVLVQTLQAGAGVAQHRLCLVLAGREHQGDTHVPLHLSSREVLRSELLSGSHVERPNHVAAIAQSNDHGCLGDAGNPRQHQSRLIRFVGIEPSGRFFCRGNSHRHLYMEVFLRSLYNTLYV
jgi:hypothetical protein